MNLILTTLSSDSLTTLYSTSHRPVSTQELPWIRQATWMNTWRVSSVKKDRETNTEMKNSWNRMKGGRSSWRNKEKKWIMLSQRDGEMNS